MPRLAAVRALQRTRGGSLRTVPIPSVPSVAVSAKQNWSGQHHLRRPVD